MRSARFALCLTVSCFLSGCAAFGPNVLRSERISYNEAIHDTSAEQLLLNLVRTHDYESPSFSNIAEVDSTPSISFGLTGGSANLGAHPPVLGALSSSVSASESAIQKHVSVTGFELIQQISTPIALSNIYRLQNSNEPTIPLLVLSINQFGSGYVEYNRIINLIYLLDLYGALVIEARTYNTMTISLSKRGVVSFADPNVVGDKSLACIGSSSPRKTVQELWRELKSALELRMDDTPIVLRNAEAKIIKDDKSTELDSARARMQVAGTTLVLSRSGLGAMRMSQSHDVQFVDPVRAEEIIRENQAAECHEDDFYFISTARSPRPIAQKWIDFYGFAFADRSVNQARYITRDLGSSRVLLIVQVSDFPPMNAYVSVFKGGLWYSIRNDDVVSKKNFALLHTLQTIQAVPSASQPTPTTISAGGH